MYLIGFLIGFPVLVGMMMFVCKNIHTRRIIVCTASFLLIAATLWFAAGNFFTVQKGYYLLDTEWIDALMLVIEFLISGYIVYFGARFKKYYASFLAVLQLGLMLWLEQSGQLHQITEFYIYVDKLSVIMSVIIAVIGCLICIYAIGYMEDYHHHHKEYIDRRPFFFAVLFIFIGAMFGIVFSNNLVWMYFFWEITTFCSYLLIGYTQTKEAIHNSFRALWMNLLGGCCFVLAIIYCCFNLQTLELNSVIEIGLANPQLVLIPTVLFAFAGLTKSAQLPFSSWLLGAMVAPTPSSALLHSATMVKAGVYLIIRISPLLCGSLVGFMVTTVGGFTFLAASLLAVSQSDAKKVLAYSTIANLGLITACAGVGRPEAVWAAVLLMVFHAVSKSLMFLSVGTIENAIGSRDIEDMHGLIVRLPYMTLLLIIGIAGMFLAPFGMLISKWAALKSFIDSDSMLLIIFLIFGSAATLLYWTKWLGKLVAVVNGSKRVVTKSRKTEVLSLVSHMVLMVSLCVLFPVLSHFLIEPYLTDVFGVAVSNIIGQGNLNIMILMLITMAISPIAISFLSLNKNAKIVSSYMGGINEGDDRTFVDSFGQKKQMYLSNWYFENYFGEARLLNPCTVISAVFVFAMFVMCIGGII